MIKAYSLQTQILIDLNSGTFRLERRDGCGGVWLVLTDSGFVPDGEGVTPIPVTGNYVDGALFNGICQYRARNFSDDTSPWN
jgi:hypothetical protein